VGSVCEGGGWYWWGECGDGVRWVVDGGWGDGEGCGCGYRRCMIFCIVLCCII